MFLWLLGFMTQWVMMYGFDVHRLKYMLKSFNCSDTIGSRYDTWRYITSFTGTTCCADLSLPAIIELKTRKKKQNYTRTLLTEYCRSYGREWWVDISILESVLVFQSFCSCRFCIRFRFLEIPLWRTMLFYPTNQTRSSCTSLNSSTMAGRVKRVHWKVIMTSILQLMTTK